ncbi:hypothetical protein ACLQ25_09420 [Micromonospora sp. DT44]|uniref:hypothetical protein n=1 Tax=Micromonospora sp. DT44 TaxID=3393439 RepID=UPI003CEFD97B
MADPVRDPEIPDLYSLQQATTRLGYASKQSLLNRVTRGEVACARVGNSYVFRAALIDQLAATEVAAD